MKEMPSAVRVHLLENDIPSYDTGQSDARRLDGVEWDSVREGRFVRNKIEGDERRFDKSQGHDGHPDTPGDDHDGGEKSLKLDAVPEAADNGDN